MATSKRSTPKKAPPKKSTPKKRSLERPLGAAPSRRKVPVVKPVVNEALRARYAKHLAEFRRARGAEASTWDAAYESLAPILAGDPPLFLAGGFKSARAFVAAELPGMKLDTVRDYVRVATHFDPAAEQRHGVTRLALLLDYLEATNGGALPAARIDPDRAEVTVGGEPLPFAEMTFVAMRDALRGATRGTTRPTDPPEVRALRAVLDKHGLGNLAVAFRAGCYTLGRIEARQFQDLSAALARAARAKPTPT